jgi:hypothetical protein
MIKNRDAIVEEFIFSSVISIFPLLEYSKSHPSDSFID